MEKAPPSKLKVVPLGLRSCGSPGPGPPAGSPLNTAARIVRLCVASTRRRSPGAAGDDASGTNHILPTGGAARLRGGLSAADFVKTITVQKLDRRGLRNLRRAIVTLAETEGLKAHAYSVETRFTSDGSTA